MGEHLEKEILVSVVVPVYNTELYLEECLSSLRKQTLKEVEFICVDDGSTDCSVDIIKKYCEQDERFRMIKRTHTDGTGAGPARNLGLDFAVGKYIIFLDSDDFFEETLLEKTYEKAEKTKAQVVIFDAWLFDDREKTEAPSVGVLEKETIPNKNVFSAQDVQESIFQITWGSAWNMMYLRKYILDSEIQFQGAKYMDDAKFVYIALCLADRITTLDHKFIHYRYNTATSQSAKRYEYSENMYKIPLEIREELINRKKYEQFKESYIKKFIYYMLDFVFKQKEYSLFKENYNILKNIVFKKINIEDYIKNAKQTTFLYRTICEIMDTEPEEFIFKRISREMEIDGYQIPDCIKKKKIIIYGAGGYGRKTYAKLLSEEICTVVSWVDKRYSQIGYPVERVESIEAVDFDFILICVTDDHIVYEIKSKLLGRGIEENKLVRLQKNIV